MTRLQKFTRTAILTSAALVVFVIECQLPSLTAIPGIKLGLSNIFTLFALYVLGPGWALGLLLCRIFLGSLLTGQMMAMLYSFCGGILAFAVMWLLKKAIRQTWVVSVFGALSHQVGQMAAAIAVTQTADLLYYLPVLLLAGILTGSFTGLCAQLLLKRLQDNGFWRKDEGAFS